MMVPQFMRFYGYTASSTLDEYARTFFGLLNQMFRLQAEEALTDINTTSAAMSGKDGQSVIDGYKKQAGGLHSIVQEVRTVKNG